MSPLLGASSATSGVTRQTLTATVAPSATLALLPDFLTCFRGADYEQSQEIRMLRGGNLVLVDWYTSGRMGRGESWAFRRLSSNT
ncbi:urease accessory protein, partial [Nannochloropsis gaditana CCMP526]|uniref:urease accessory protein n=1 Tax=Nannochloropsis gaditana (strain CCMP526) TaxID=1093141 RepID=UPI00029F6D93